MHPTAERTDLRSGLVGAAQQRQRAQRRMLGAVLVLDPMAAARLAQVLAQQLARLRVHQSPGDVRSSSDTSSLRHVLHGAAPCPVPVKHRIIEWFGPVVMEYYAATEGVGSFVDSATWLQRPGTVGLPFGTGQVVVGDDEGTPLPLGEVGLIYLLAPGASRFSYFKDDEQTRSA